MKIKYIFASGETSTVEVDEAVDTPFTGKETQKEFEYALTLLTDTQRRRLLLYIQGLPMCEIASREGILYISVRDSIKQA